MEYVILVDEEDNEIGTEEKIKAHRDVKLHRAFSCLVFNAKNELMLQQRALCKYHSPGLWTNTCCSHPRKGEYTEAAVHRRLKEEVGFDCLVEEITTLIYKAPFDNGLTEHEYLHVFCGRYNGELKLNPEECEDSKWINLTDLKEDVSDYPENYTEWFKILLNKHFESIKSWVERKPKIGVGVVVRKDGKILLGKRKGAHGEGTWHFPGGHLEYGESVEKCAERETLEETGMRISNIKQIAYTNDIFDEGKHYVTLFVLGEYLSGEVKVIEPHKCEEWKWFDWQELPKPLFLPIQNLIKQGYNP